MVYRFVSEPFEPFERGTRFGAAHREQIARSVHAYREIFTQSAAGARVDLSALGAPFLATIESWAPHLGEELHGMARGAGVDSEQLAAINARTEILAQFSAAGRGECSALALLRGGGRRPVALQTWDWYTTMSDNWLEWTIRRPDGGRVTTVTEFGLLGKIGVNEHGVALLFNILHHAADTGQGGVPVHIVARRILDTATDLSTALDVARSAKVSASTAMTVVTAAGEAATAELWPQGPDVLGPTEPAGAVLHTNHFLARRAEAGDLERATWPDTVSRYLQLQEAAQLDGPGEDLGENHLLDALADHSAGGDAVCCHPEPGATGLQFATLATVVVDFAARTLNTHAGGPCTHEARASSSSPGPTSAAT